MALLNYHNRFLEGLTIVFVHCRFSMPYTPLRQLKPEGLTAMFGAFNFDDLDSDEEVPEQEQRRWDGSGYKLIIQKFFNV